jgi:hypothetical protein
VEKGGERDDADNLTKLAKQSRDLGHHRRAFRGKPGGNDAKDAGKDRGVAGPKQNSSSNCDAHVGRDGHHKLARCHQQHPRGHHNSRAEPVE